MLILCLSNCTPVRNTTFNKNKSRSSDDSQNNNKIVYKPRFVDTTIIKLPDVLPPQLSVTNEISELFNSALKDFDNQDYASATNKFSNIQSTVTEDDSLYYEAEFYLIEIIITENKLDEANNRLELILNSPHIDENLAERVLVRLGQIHCTKNNNKKALTYFSRLHDINPNSIYIKVANCDFLNKRVK